MFEEVKSQFKNGSAVTRLIIVNVVLFIAFILLRLIFKLTHSEGLFGSFFGWFSLPLNWNEFIYKPWTIITYMFMHDLRDIWHILWNMVFLYWFGIILDDFIGKSKVFPIYLVGGIIGGIFALLTSLVYPFNGALIGASGAVYAVMVAAVILVPNHKFNLLFIGPVSIKYIALFKLVIDLMNINEEVNLGGHICHLGGAFAGWLIMSQIKSGNDITLVINKSLFFMESLFKRRKKIKLVHSNPGMAKKAPKVTDKQKKIDEILDKISKSGYDSLTQEEKEFLFKTSNEA